MPVPPSQDARPLSAVPAGTSGVLEPGSVPGDTRLRLGQLGLRTGTTITVISRTAGGGRLVGVGSSRIGLDRDTARRLVLTTAVAPA